MIVLENYLHLLLETLCEKEACAPYYTMMRRIFFDIISLFLFLTFIFAPSVVFGDVRINEIMYDLPSSDDGREWVELYNSGPDAVDLTGWKFFDGANHVLNTPPKNGGTGSLIIEPNSYVILADDATTFISEFHTNVSVVDTVMSLGQQKDKIYSLKLINKDGNSIGEITYSSNLGASGDGNSLQFYSGSLGVGAPTPGAQNVINTSENNVENPQLQIESNSSSTTQTVSQSTGIQVEPVPSLILKPSAPTVVVAGADAEFSVQVFGAKKEQIQNARVIWSFGNGAVREGNKVRFSYTIPGSYAVIITAASGEFSGTSRFSVKAVQPDLAISKIASGPNGFVEIENKSNTELDLFGWDITSGNITFSIPEKTFLLPKTKVAFPASVTGVFVINDDARLLFPNGKIAAEYVKRNVPENISRPDLSRDTLLKEGVQSIPTLKEVPQQQVEAVDVPASIVLSEKNSSSKIFPWIFGVAGIGILGIAGLAALKYKPIIKDDSKIEERFADKIQIDSF
jgi:hypothetical protein